MAKYGARHTLIFCQVAANYRVLAVASCQLPWTHSYKRVEETHEEESHDCYLVLWAAHLLPAVTVGLLGPIANMAAGFTFPVREGRKPGKFPVPGDDREVKTGPGFNIFRFII